MSGPSDSGGDRPVIVGVAGGSGSGKSTVVRRIVEGMGGRPPAVLRHDAYYRDLSHLAPDERDRVNFDHPDALETPLLIEHLRTLQAGRAVEVPIYDFTTHTRTARTTPVPASSVVLLDGILVLAEPGLRDLMDIKVFVDTDADVRFIRRLERDLEHRGRTVESVVEQYRRTVRPMHLEFVEPSKRYADVIVPEGGENRVAVEMLVTRLSRFLES